MFVKEKYSPARVNMSLSRTVIECKVPQSKISGLFAAKPGTYIFRSRSTTGFFCGLYIAEAES